MTVAGGEEGRSPDRIIAELLPAMGRLDRLLEGATAAARAAYGAVTSADSFRGLYIGEAEVDRLLAREPGKPLLWDPEACGDADASPGLAWLAHAFGLNPLDVDVLLLALAPELDSRYERLYAYLQDDVTRRRPTVDLALNLLCPSPAAKLAARGRFAPDAPLVRHRLIHFVADVHRPDPPLLGCSFKLDDGIARRLLGQGGSDQRLVSFCRRVEPAAGLSELPLDAETKRVLGALVIGVSEGRAPLRLHLYGPAGVGKRAVAVALAAEVGKPLWIVDLALATSDGDSWEEGLGLAVREARLQGALLYLAHFDVIAPAERVAELRHLTDLIAEHPGIVICGSTGVEAGLPGAPAVSIPPPDYLHRCAWWYASLSAEGISIPGDEIDILAARFRLTPRQIAKAATSSRSRALWHLAAQERDSVRAHSPLRPDLSDLFAAARAESGLHLATLARKIEPVYTWDDIVLPEDSLAQLREICQRVGQRERVLGDWGFGLTMSLGKGTSALFAGPSGTGKTMAAEVIANELGFDLYTIELAGVVSKYIGETEKNLDRIFTAAENADAILFFDEADALFGKRSEVRDSHDRYANIEISYLLQKMELYQGVAILATNLRQHLDEAFVRRLAFTVHFPFPGEADRRRIWAGIWPDATPLAEDVDAADLASRFKLAGGNIRNIALAAAYSAAHDGGAVTTGHLLRATRREFQKMGKTLSDAELDGHVAGAFAGRPS